MEIKITKDIRKYKTKDVGNFSLKEVGWIALGLASAFLTYRLSKSVEIAFLPLLVFVVFGFAKPLGLTMTQFLRTVVRDALSPQIYYWETDFEYNFDEFEDLYGKDITYVTDDSAFIQNGESVKYTKNEKARIIK